MKQKRVEVNKEKLKLIVNLLHDLFKQHGISEIEGYAAMKMYSRSIEVVRGARMAAIVRGGKE